VADEHKFREDSPAVQAHLGIIQAVIQRMASNSASCKAWCITLVSAILVIVADKGKPRHAVIAAVPTILFFVLDSYYLSLEKRFRDSYNSFIDKLHRGRVTASDLYAVTPHGPPFSAFVAAVLSFSIWPFYLALAGMIWLAKRIVIP
jgi:hypothetical protein